MKFRSLTLNPVDQVDRSSILPSSCIIATCGLCDRASRPKGVRRGKSTTLTLPARYTPVHLPSFHLVDPRCHVRLTMDGLIPNYSIAPGARHSLLFLSCFGARQQRGVGPTKADGVVSRDPRQRPGVGWPTNAPPLAGRHPSFTVSLSPHVPICLGALELRATLADVTV